MQTDQTRVAWWRIIASICKARAAVGYKSLEGGAK